MTTSAVRTTSVAIEHRLQELIDQLHAKHVSADCWPGGHLHPELGKANPEHFGICVVTAEGDVMAAGDCDVPFTIQSISKPFTFGMALEDLGEETVSRFRRRRAERRRVQLNLAARGHEPAVQPDGQHRRDRGHGAAASPLRRAHVRTDSRALQREWPDGRCRWTEAVYDSERRHWAPQPRHRHLLLNFDLVHDQAEAALDVYFKQCSILVTTRDLATMARRWRTWAGTR
jgi:glutaminase